MCGILGVYGKHQISKDEFINCLNLQEKRGPDNITALSHNGNLLGHARLAIHDLSTAANQPMFSACRRYSIVFNGEIYNFRELKSRYLKYVNFKTDSDTEVLLNLLIELGVNKTLSLIEGMFAFSFFDSSENKVFAARDNCGEKPLYYHLGNKYFAVSSSLLSLGCLFNLNDISEQALSTYLHYGYCKGSDSIIKEVKKVNPSSYIEYDITNRDAKFVDYEHLSPKNKSGSLDLIIRDSVKKCLDADVSVGCFLSGGVDSSLISSYVSQLSKKTITAYALGFYDDDYDESDAAINIAKHLNMPIRVKKLSYTELSNLVDEMQDIFDEPFADASSLAMFAVSKFARKDVTVCLSGDGGDELFSGYNRHVLVGSIYGYSKFIPYFFRVRLAKMLSVDSAFRPILKLVFSLVKPKVKAVDEKLDKLSVILGYRNHNDLLFRILSGLDYSSVLNLPEPFKPEIKSFEPRVISSYDLNSYLHEDVLVKVDRCSMAASLEARAPLLNPNIINYSINCDDGEHVRGGVQKYALRELLYKKVPRELIDRPKSGFSVPYKKIVDESMKDKFLSFRQKLESSSINKHSVVFDLLSIVDDYYSGEFSDYKFVWNIYFYFLWYFKYQETLSLSS